MGTRDRQSLRPWGEILRPWFDLRSRRPVVLLVVASMVLLVTPLAWEWILVGIDSIPHQVAWWLGQSTLLVLLAVGTWRLLQVRPGDSWPTLSGRTWSDTWTPWALRLAIASMFEPMLHDPEAIGIADWDFVMDKYEAIRRTVLIWGQFPWWNPWCRGGFPLAAEPQIGVASIATPMVLALGTSVGLRIAAVLQIGIAVEGSYRLARLWLGDAIGAAVAAIVYAINGAAIVNTVDGYIIVMGFSSLPWLAYHAFRIREGVRHGIGLGFWAAFAVLNGIQYTTIYGAFLVLAIILRGARIQPPTRWRQRFRPLMAAAGTFFLLAGWRCATMFPVLLEDRRERVTYWDESLGSVLRYLLDRPPPNWMEVLPGRAWASYCSLTSYIGYLVGALVILSLFRGWRWWHTMIVLTGWLALGSVQWYQPSRWLSDWPFLGSAHVVTRWRFVTMLGFGLAAGSVVARWRIEGGKVRPAIAAAVALAIAADYVRLAHEQLPKSFSVRLDSTMFPGPPVTGIIQIRSGLGYPCVLRGYGVIEGYEPMLSYFRNATTLRKARGEPGYRGEAWTDAGEVRPVYWSPNLQVFQVRPGETVHINQNPGSWWLANGRRIFAGRRCAELMLDFAASADASGRLELRIEPPEVGMGIALHVVGAIILLVIWQTGPVRPTGSGRGRSGDVLRARLSRGNAQ